MRKKRHKNKSKRPVTPEPEERPARTARMESEPESKRYTLPRRWWQGRDVGQIVVTATGWQRAWMDWTIARCGRLETTIW